MIKHCLKGALFLALTIATLTSCNKEELVDLTNTETLETSRLAAVDASDETTTVVNDIFARRGTNGGGGNGEPCFTLTYPVTVIYPDGTTQMANDRDELKDLFRDFRDNQEEDSEEELMLEYPIDVTLEDSTMVTLNSAEELEVLKDECQADDDHHNGNGNHNGGGNCNGCFEYNFPITVVYPDGTTQMAADKDELKDLFRDFRDSQEEDSEEELTFEYPIDVTLQDSTIVTLNSAEELEALKDECQENDDNHNGNGNGNHNGGGNGNDCFDINFPISVVYPDGTVETADNKHDLRHLFRAFNESQEEDSEEELEIQYPIDVTLEDETVMTLNSEAMLDALIESCED